MISEELRKPSIRDWIGTTTKVQVEKLDATRAWRQRLPALGIKLEGGLLKDDEGNHFFLSMQRRGTEILTDQERSKGIKHQFDTENSISQPPLLRPQKGGL